MKKKSPIAISTQVDALGKNKFGVTKLLRDTGKDYFKIQRGEKKLKKVGI